jgi:hypothetical protein
MKAPNASDREMICANLALPSFRGVRSTNPESISLREWGQMDRVRLCEPPRNDEVDKTQTYQSAG